MKKVLTSMVTVLLLWLLCGCSTNYREIPAGYIGKVLTPTGWQEGLLEAGQVDIKEAEYSGLANRLILMEATSVSIKEGFGMASGNDKEDHRILISSAPVSVDIYVRMMVPTDPKKRDGIFSMITPDAVRGTDRTYAITCVMIYGKLAQMDVRSQIRAILQNAASVQDINRNLDKYNDLLGAALAKTFEKNGVPLLLQNATISNVKVDESVWQAENQKQAALSQVEAINKIGAAIRDNPGYLAFKKYETYEKISGKIGTFTIIEGAPGGVVVGR